MASSSSAGQCAEFAVCGAASRGNFAITGSTPSRKVATPAMKQLLHFPIA
jgi:hypothetical protein